MSTQLRKAITNEIQRRHGYKVMEAKIKPVHIANALMRAEHQGVGRMSVLEQLFEATLPKNSLDKRVAAVRSLVDGQRDRWGALGEAADLKSSALMTKVLPLIRTLLGADGAVFGKSPELSSFSSPTALTVTGDPSDDGAGLFIHRLWGGHDPAQRLQILNLLSQLTNPEKNPADMDDLSALLSPLVDSTRKRATALVDSEDLKDGYSPIETSLRDAADKLEAYERKLNPNPIASLQRVVLLAALSVFMHAASRPRERLGLPERVLLLDASGDHSSPTVIASTRCVSQVIGDARSYMASVVADLLSAQSPEWHADPVAALNGILQDSGAAPLEDSSSIARRLQDIVQEHDDPREAAQEAAEEVIRQAEGSSSRGLDGYLRLLGIRSGFLYPTQKNPNKRLNPADRTLEVLVASTIDVNQPPLEYRDFLDLLRQKWSIVVGGRADDGILLAEIGATVPARALSENSERFLSRLESIGLARRLADSVAVVGLLEANHE
ncbi:MAG: hypothetical protein J0I65_28105 [Variovorax sp.]|nr:hypothetical protein [Variovorax sp.]